MLRDTFIVSVWVPLKPTSAGTAGASTYTQKPQQAKSIMFALIANSELDTTQSLWSYVKEAAMFIHW